MQCNPANKIKGQLILQHSKTADQLYYLMIIFHILYTFIFPSSNPAVNLESIFIKRPYSLIRINKKSLINYSSFNYNRKTCER